METLLPLISLLTLCLSAIGLYLLYKSMVMGGSAPDGAPSSLDMEKRKKQQKWGIGLLMAGYAGGVIVLYFLA